MSKIEYKIFAFRAVDEPNLCQQYVKGHLKVLTDYGIENVTSNNNTWTKNSNIYCIGLKSNNDSKLLGGIRIQLADGIHPLPVEDAIGYLDQEIYSRVQDYAINGGIGELSGLWVSNDLKGLSFGHHLVRASIASSNQLNFKTLIGICAGYSLNMFINVGFMIDRSLGNKGDFPYPNKNYLAHVVGILKTSTLKSASAFDKKIMESLRNNIIQNRYEISSKINTNYNLKYLNVSEVNYFLKSNIKPPIKETL